MKTNMQDRMAAEAAKLEKWHVRYWTTNKGKREGFFVMLDSERNVSGSPLANCKTHEEAQRMCDEHNASLLVPATCSIHWTGKSQTTNVTVLAMTGSRIARRHTRSIPS